MSWNIYLFAEISSDSMKTWKPLTDKCVCDNFKYYDNDFYDSLPYMKVSDSSHPSVNSFADTDKVKFCTLTELRNHYNKIIESILTRFRSLYLALGVSTSVICADYSEYEDSGNDDSWIKRMTFPVNKELLYDAALSLSVYNKASEVIGICNTLDNLKNDYNDEIRLTFIPM